MRELKNVTSRGGEINTEREWGTGGQQTNLIKISLIKRLIDFIRGPLVILLAGDSGIPGLILRDKISRLHQILILWTVTPSLVEAFHSPFYSPPHRRPTLSAFHHPVGLSIP